MNEPYLATRSAAFARGYVLGVREGKIIQDAAIRKVLTMNSPQVGHLYDTSIEMADAVAKHLKSVQERAAYYEGLAINQSVDINALQRSTEELCVRINALQETALARRVAELEQSLLRLTSVAHLLRSGHATAATLLAQYHSNEQQSEQAQPSVCPGVPSGPH